MKSENNGEVAKRLPKVAWSVVLEKVEGTI